MIFLQRQQVQVFHVHQFDIRGAKQTNEKYDDARAPPLRILRSIPLNVHRNQFLILLTFPEPESLFAKEHHLNPMLLMHQ